MKYLLIGAVLTFNAVVLEAQTVGTGQKTGSATSQSRNGNSTNSAAANQKGNTGKKEVIPQSHGSKDVTPGSPVGTGGAGEGNMAGSPAGSAIETKDQTDKATITPENQAGRKKSTIQKGSAKRKTGNKL